MCFHFILKVHCVLYIVTCDIYWMNSIYRTWNWDVHQRNHYVDKLPQIDEVLSSFKRPQMNYSNVLKPSLLGYFLFIPSWMVGKLMTQFLPDTQTLLSVPRWGKGKVGEKQRMRERSSRQMTSCWCGSTFLCVRYLSSTLTFFFLPKDMETWPSNREVSERFLFYNALKLFPYG